MRGGRSNDLAEIAETISTAEELGQVGMSRSFVPALEATHGLGPDLVGQTNDSLGGRRTQPELSSELGYALAERTGVRV